MVPRLISQDDESHVILLDRPMIIVGRHPTCEARLDSPRISRRHCCVAYDNDQVIVRDLGSTNGIRINGQRVDSGRLRDGDELTIAHLKFRFQLDSKSSSAPLDHNQNSPVHRGRAGDSRTLAAAQAAQPSLLASHQPESPAVKSAPAPDPVHSGPSNLAQTSSIDFKQALAKLNLPDDFKNDLLEGMGWVEQSDPTPETITRLLTLLIQQILGDNLANRISLSVEIAPPLGHDHRIEGGAPRSSDSNGFSKDVLAPHPSSSSLPDSRSLPRV